MKTRYWLILCFACLLIGGGSWALIDYYYFPCTGTYVFNWVGPTKTVIKSTDTGCVTRDIEIIGKQRDKFIDIQASDGCKTGYRTMEIDVKTAFPKWSLKLGILGGAGYQQETKQFDALLGAELELFRHFKAFGVGGGIWYMQGVATNYKAGGLKADILFSWGRQ